MNNPLKLFTKKPLKKSYSLFRPMILSRHPSHDILRSKHQKIRVLPYQSVVRFGSTTEVADTIAKGGKRIEINTIEAIKNSSSKLLMKQKFTEAEVKTAEWISGTQNTLSQVKEWAIERYPIVAKNHYGSKGKGNTLIKNVEELNEWAIGKTIPHYIFEKFMNYALEYRFHITEDGCFYVCRKALKKDCPEDQKWRHHDDTCVWFLETNENFMKPNSYNDIVDHCVRALKTIGADILSFDVKVQGPKTSKGELRNYQEFILLECNSASSMGDYNGEPSICAQKYIDIIPKIIIKKGNGK